jgi:hypothetical protein
MIFRPALYADVEHILDNLSDISAREMDVLQLDRWHAMGRARMCKKSGGLDCLLEKRGPPLAVIGTVQQKDRPYIHRTWFLASQEYFDMGARAVFGSMRYITALALSQPNITLEAITLSTHPHVERWFAHMGFEKVDHSVYVRKPKVDDPKASC